MFTKFRRCATAALFVFWAVVLLGHPAVAATLRSEGMGLSMVLQPPGALVCMIHPAAERDPAACEGLDVTALEATFRSKADAADQSAVVRFEDWGFRVSMLPRTGLRLVTSEDIEKLVRGLERASLRRGFPARAHGVTTDNLYDLIQVNGAHVVRFQLESEVPAEHPMYDVSGMLHYAFVGTNAYTFVTFTCPEKELARLVPVAEAMVQTAMMPPTPIKNFGKSRSNPLTYGADALLECVMPTMMLLLMGAMALEQRRRKKKQKEAA